MTLNQVATSALLLAAYVLRSPGQDLLIGALNFAAPEKIDGSQFHLRGSAAEAEPPCTTWARRCASRLLPLPTAGL